MVESTRLKFISQVLPKSHIQASNGQSIGEFPFFTSSQNQNKFLDQYLFDSEYIIMGTGGVASIHYYNGKFAVSTDCIVLDIEDKYYTKFVYYFLKAHQKIIDDLGFEGSGLKHLQKDFLFNLKINDIPLNEQQRISNYLDNQIVKYDAIITKNKELINLLEEKRITLINNIVTKGLNPNAPMKYSGIDWVGDIPEQWDVIKLKQICNVLGRIGFRGYKASDLVSEGEGAYTIGAKHIQNNKLDLSDPEYLSWEKYYESPEIMVQLGDLLITQRGAKLGKIALIEEDISPATINPSLIILKNIQCEGKFLYYLLCSQYILKTIELINSHTAVPMISQDQVNNFTIFNPPHDEQIQIIKYLDESISEIDNIIIKINENISLLEEYKTSLIYNVITGKIMI